MHNIFCIRLLLSLVLPIVLVFVLAAIAALYVTMSESRSVYLSVGVQQVSTIVKIIWIELEVLVSLRPAPAQAQPLGQAKVAIISAYFFLNQKSN